MTTMLLESQGENADLERDWWFVSSNPFSKVASYAVLIPATDPAALPAQFKEKQSERNIEDYDSMIYQSWVIYGSKAGVEELQQSIAANGPSFEAGRNPKVESLFQSGDVGVFIDIQQLTTANALGFALGQGIIQAAISSYLSEVKAEGQNQEIMASLREIPTQLTSGLFQMITDTQLLAISLSIEPDEIRIENYTSVKEDSPTDAFLQSNPGSKMECLASLPNSSAVYVGVHANWNALRHWVTQICSIAAEANYKPKQAYEFIKLLEAYEDLNYGDFAIAFPMRPFEQGVIRSLTLTEVDRPERLRELDSKLAEYPLFGGKANELHPELSTEKYGEFQVEVIRAGLPPAIRIDDGQIQKQIESILYGAEGNVQRTIYLKDRIVRSVGGTKVRSAAAIHRVVDFSKTTSNAGLHFARTREKLGDKVNLLVMFDMGGISATAMALYNVYLDAILEASANAQIAAPNAPQLDGDNQVDDDDVQEPERVKRAGDEPGDSDAPPARNDKKRLRAANDDAQDAMKDQIKQSRFTSDEIDTLSKNPTLIGFSLAFEPQGSRLRIVFPVGAIKQTVHAGDTILRRMSTSAFDAGDFEIAPIELEDKPETAPEEK